MAPGQLGHTWHAALLLDNFSPKIYLTNGLLLKEGKTLLKHGHRLLSPLNGARREGRESAILSIHRLFLSNRRNGFLTPLPTRHLIESTRSGQFPCTLSLSVVCIKVCRLRQRCIIWTLCSRHHTGAGDAKRNKTRLLSSESSWWG